MNATARKGMRARTVQRQEDQRFHDDSPKVAKAGCVLTGNYSFVGRDERT